MDIKIGMPEILVVFAFVIYSQSFTFSAIAFCLGLLGRTFNQNVDELGTAFKDLFGGKKD